MGFKRYGRDSLQFNINEREAIVLRRHGVITWFKDRKPVAEVYYKPMFDFTSVFPLGKDLHFIPESERNNTLVKVSAASGKSSSQLKGDLLQQVGKAPRILCRNNASGDLL